MGDELAQLHWLIESQRAIFATQLRDFDRSGGYAPSGALSAAGWLRAECRLAPSAAAEQVRVAKALPQLPETAEAFAGGQISFQHAALISRSAEEVGLAVVQEAEPALLEAARQLDPTGCGWSPATSATAWTPRAPRPRPRSSTSAGVCT